MRRVTMALALAAFAAGCSPIQDAKAADAQIAGFHQKLNAGDFAGQYAVSSPELKAATPQAAWLQLMAAVHRKLGAFQSGKDTGWNENVNTSGHWLVIGYAATYERGTATETFTFKIDAAGQAELAGYNVNSAALIAN